MIEYVIIFDLGGEIYFSGPREAMFLRMFLPDIF